MSATIYRQGIYRTDTQESYEVETRGHMHLMPKGAQQVEAIFGWFSRLPNGHLLYSTSSEMATVDECNAAYTDDLRALARSEIRNVEYTA